MRPQPIPKIAQTILWADVASVYRWAAYLMYYLVVPFQKRYVMEDVDKIFYARDDRLFTTSDAIKNGAVRGNQVMTRYRNGLEVAVNGSETRNWKVRLGDRDYVVPPGGWAARQGGGFESYALKVDGRWMATTLCPEWEVDVPYGGVQEFRSAISSTGLVLRFDDPRGIRLIPFEKFDAITLKIGVDRIQAYDAQDRLLGNVPVSQGGKGVVIRGGAPDVSYYIVEAKAGSEKALCSRSVAW